MNVTAVSPISRVAAPYAARIPLLDDTRPVWEAEWAARNAATRLAQRSAQAQAAWQAQRIARTATDSAQADRDVRAAQPAMTQAPQALAAAPAAVNVDQLRDLYADARLRRAVDDFSARPDPVALRGDTANDLGTIEGLTPLQPYRVAMGNPQVQELQTAVAMKAAGLNIPKVENIGPTENVTDNARYRPGART
ncbi:hypothetical protein LMG3458_01198 [Achromobacter deleyi]|uniref:Uncharacterized protein n=1 Tax=Achromobacter deleyi TaxID=1353891 RepID=A0A6S6ZFL3_9BURK|nr:hypothetical protein [Achromobacter deleyi]CAB3672979.1 hypothetical protein LMG3458_01198 [Achromobacter deleyi]CAB3835562.1 hypothetical protein LMG3481_00979 [Achromobacter deleyi]CAB3844410.1 hypothetical protein LMG3482_01438 [Achromobacter deleyi]